jgi:hypothetical protein
MAAETHLVFVWAPTGYELREQDGAPPEVGATLEIDGRRELVSKIGPSPHPGDTRPCVYLQG